MDWSNERYVRIYTRETVGDVALTWQGRAIWKEILMRCDRAGVIALDGHGVRGLAGLIRMPQDVVADHFHQLLDDGRIQIHGDHLVVPNFIEAQEAIQSDKQRARESRARRREKAILGEILSRNEANSHETKPGVTPGHAVSHGVTPCLAVPNRTVPNRTNTPPSPPGGNGSREKYSVEFEDFRSKYPGHRLGGKLQDWKSWKVAKKAGLTVELADEYLGYWLESPKWKSNAGKYIVALSRWLRDGYWQTVPGDYEPSGESSAQAMRRRSVEALKQDVADENELFGRGNGDD